MPAEAGATGGPTCSPRTAARRLVRSGRHDPQLPGLRRRATGTLSRKATVVGIGETAYTKRGETTEPEYQLACRAILAA